MNLLKKITLSLLGLSLFLSMQMRIHSPEIQSKTRTCLAQMSVSADESIVQIKSGDSLKEIAKPYLGVYECEWLYFGGEDKKDIFEYLRVELKTKDELVLTYKLKDGDTGKVPLSYKYDFDEKMLRVSGQWLLLKIDRKFPLKNGEITVVMNLFGKLVNVKFSRN